MTTPLRRPLPDLLESMSSGEPGPAAGSAAAVAAGLGAALLAKAARLSERHLDDAARVVAQADALRERALLLAEADAEAVAAAVGATVRPASQDAARDAAGRDAVADAIAVPRRIGELAAEVGRLAAVLGEQGNPRLRADAVAARHLAEAAQRCADAIVRSNADLLG